MASLLVQPFLQGSRSLQTDRLTDRPHYSVCSNMPQLVTAVMRPKQHKHTTAPSKPVKLFTASHNCDRPLGSFQLLKYNCSPWWLILECPCHVLTAEDHPTHTDNQWGPSYTHTDHQLGSYYTHRPPMRSILHTQTTNEDHPTHTGSSYTHRPPMRTILHTQATNEDHSTHTDHQWGPSYTHRQPIRIILHTERPSYTQTTNEDHLIHTDNQLGSSYTHRPPMKLIQLVPCVCLSANSQVIDGKVS